MNLPDTVKYFMVLDPRAGSERFVLALEGPKGERQYVGKQNSFNGLRGISGKEGGGKIV